MQDAVEKFVHGVQVLVRIGAFIPMCEQAAGSSDIWWRFGYPRHNWRDEPARDLLYRSIMANTYPPELMLLIARTAPEGFPAEGAPSAAMIVEAAREACNRTYFYMHNRFRREHGHHEETTEEVSPPARTP